MTGTGRIAITTVLVLLLPRLLRANGFGPAAVTAYGDIDESRPLPRFSVSHVTSATAPPANFACQLLDVVLEMPGRKGRLVLDTYEVLPGETAQEARENALARDCVYGDTVRAGWLRGAPDILLLHWTDASGMAGTGHYLGGLFLLARVTDTELQPLLRHSAVFGANIQHAFYGSGLGTCRFSFNEADSTCQLQAWFHGEAESDRPRPLHHPAVDEGGKEFYRAVLSEEVTATWLYAEGTLSLESVGLTYETQEHDSLKAVALYYLGPRAPEDALVQVHPELAERFPDCAKHPGTWLPKGTRLEVPLPAEWLARYYGLGGRR